MLPTSRKTRVVLVGAVAALALGSGSASAAASGIADPTGDVHVVHSATQQQRATVDITAVRYAVSDGRLVITTHVVDLAHTPGNQFMETEVGTGGSSFTLTSMVGETPVKIFTGSTLYACKGASTTARFGQDVVRQVVPVKCLDAAQVRLKSSSVLAKDNGSPIARDGVRRSGTIELEGSASGR